MTNLLIGYNEIGLAAVNITSSNTCSDLYPVENLISHNKSHWVTFTSSVTTNTFKYDLGYDGAANITKVASYFAFPAQYINTANNFSVDLEASNDDVTYTPILAISEADLIAGKTGFYGEDYLDTFTESSDYRYWQVVVTDDTASNAFSGAFSKFFFGTLLDLDTDPDDIQVEKVVQTKRFVSDFGSQISQKGFNEIHNIRLTWNNLTDAKANEFINILQLQRNQLLYLYTQNNDDFFAGQSVVTANVVNYELERQDEYNQISLDLIQAV